jgi:hypothetical protein
MNAFKFMFSCLTLKKEECQKRMDGSFGFSGWSSVILGGLGLHTPSASGLILNAPILLVELNLKELENRIEEVDFYCYFSSLELIMCKCIHLIDHPRHCQQE